MNRDLSEGESTYTQAPMGDLVASAFFNDSPLRVSFAQASRIESEAELAKRLEGAENFTNDTMIRMQPRRGHDDEADAQESTPRAFIRATLDQMKRDQERQREEWSRTRSTVGGSTMSGAEWAALSRLMRSDSEFRQKLLDGFMARGMTLDEAEQRYDQIADVAEIAAIPPSQRTEEQSQIIREAEADPAFKRDMAYVTSEFANDVSPASQLNDPASQPAGEPVSSPTSERQAAITVVPTNNLGM